MKKSGGDRSPDRSFVEELQIVRFKMTNTYAATTEKFGITIGYLQNLLQRHGDLVQRAEQKYGHRLRHVSDARRHLRKTDRSRRGS